MHSREQLIDVWVIVSASHPAVEEEATSVSVPWVIVQTRLLWLEVTGDSAVGTDERDTCDS